MFFVGYGSNLFSAILMYYVEGSISHFNRRKKNLREKKNIYRHQKC